MARRSRKSDQFYKAFPKVDLHRHLEGSLRLSTLQELSRANRTVLPGTDRLRDLVQISQAEPYNFQTFLSKFETLRLFYRSPEIIGRVAREAVIDAANDNVRYLELRFTPVALSKAQGFSLAEVMDWVIEGMNEAKKDNNITVNLIISVNRHESPQLAEQVIGLALGRHEEGIVGVDLAGNEAHFPARPFASIFQDARKEGMRLTIHGGEWSGAQNVVEAITILGADRIGHGIRVMEDPHAVEIARERGTAFEVCVTSNYQSGVVTKLQDHPLPRMLEAGLNATINTDDPSISQITLSDEYRVAYEQLGISLKTLKERVLAGVRAAFLSEPERQTLLQKLTEELKSCC